MRGFIKGIDDQRAVHLDRLFSLFAVEHDPPTKSSNTSLARLVQNRLCPKSGHSRGLRRDIIGIQPGDVLIEIEAGTTADKAQRQHQRQMTNPGGRGDKPAVPSVRKEAAYEFLQFAVCSHPGKLLASVLHCFSTSVFCFQDCPRFLVTFFVREHREETRLLALRIPRPRTFGILPP